jgi:hypothetical protein
MARRHRRALAVALAAAVVCSTSVSAATVQARVTFDKRGPEITNIRLTITRDGNTWRSGPLGAAFFHRPKVLVRDLDADSELEVLLDTYTGGAHCCDQSRFFRYLPLKEAYAGTFHDWGNVGYRAKNIDGRDDVELMSNDDRFAYVFTAFAASFFPLQIWHFEHGRFIDVTEDFPGQVELDGNRLWSAYLDIRGPGADVRGVLAAWLAEQYVLGREDAGWARLEAIRKRGELGPRPDFAGWPQGRSYFKLLRSTLRRLGYE